MNSDNIVTMKEQLTDKVLLAKVSAALVKDKGLALWAIQERYEVVTRSVHTLVGSYTLKGNLEKTLTDGGLNIILVADTYNIWSKDLVVKVKNRVTNIIVVQACVYDTHRQVVFRMYSRM